MKDERCPHCGYCKHCGRSDRPVFIPSPAPVFPYWPSYPWSPVYVGDPLPNQAPTITWTAPSITTDTVTFQC